MSKNYKEEKQDSIDTDKKYNRLHQLELFAEDIVDTVRDPVLVLESDLKIVFANQSFYKTFQVSQQETEGHFLFNLGNHQWDSAQLRTLLDDVLAHGTVFKDFEVECDFNHIGKRIMHINARRLIRRADNAFFILLAIEDVTERIYLERDLLQHKNHLEHIVEERSQELKNINIMLTEEKEWLNVTLSSIGDAVIATDIKGNITLINPMAEKLLGWSRTQATGKPLSEILHIMDEKKRVRLTGLVEKIITSGKTGNICKNSILVSKDSSEKFIADSASPIWDTTGNISGAVFVFRDITEEKHMEDKLRQSHKMESIGTLAGGIAHDFNNILFVIMGYTDLAMLKITENAETRKYLEKIYQACNRAKDLVQQILAFSRQNTQTFKPIDISSVIEEAIKLLRASLPSTIKIYSNIRSDTKIIADATQIYQVVYNLCTNAAQAIQDKAGFIRISLLDVEVNENQCTVHPGLVPGKYVRLSVEDSGHGMSSDIKGKIFDPYFTTKREGKGTGMGLALVHGIITNHDGSIGVFSEPGKGTTFDVFLPAIERKSAQKLGSSPFETLAKGKEKILLVDDEKQVVNLECQMLEQLGYVVVSQTSSLKALELFSAAQDSFDLIITDMTMPEMTGYQLAERLKKIRPDIPIILCSGYNEYISEEKTKKIGINAFILKPITMIDLSKIIRKILDRKILERRHNKRFKLKEKAIAFTWSDPVEEYEVVDISWGGLAILSEEMHGHQIDIKELSINIVDKGILLDKVPCKVVSGLKIPDQSPSETDAMKKRSGIQFGRLAYNQLNLLDHLIHSYTSEYE
ncbi:MAG: PAS domain S-box-containing protein [Desulforhopalus sp.]|jgi:PAS domain S-box-containing protein